MTKHRIGKTAGGSGTAACVVAALILAGLVAARRSEGGAVPPGEATPDAGTLTVTATPKPTGQKYGPKHVMAAWVLDAKGAYVKTLARYGRKHASKLVQWKRDNPGGDTTDAVTGATLPAYGPRTFTWNGRDAAGRAAPDGRYIVRIEYTAGSGAGPCTMNALAFTKGPAAVTNRIPAVDAPPGGFAGVSLVYEPPAKR